MEGLGTGLLLSMSRTFILTEGLKLMLIGMAIVFLFLIIMVIVMKITAFLLKKLERYFPEPEEIKPGTLKSAVESHEDIALVIAAVKSYLKS